MVLSEWPRGLLLIFAVYTAYAMEPNKSEESGEMYSVDDQGEYVLRWACQASLSRDYQMP